MYVVPFLKYPAARPPTAHTDHRPQHERRRAGEDAREDVEAWKAGRTGSPSVDAALRRFLHEGRMPTGAAC